MKKSTIILMSSGFIPALLLLSGILFAEDVKPSPRDGETAAPRRALSVGAFAPTAARRNLQDVQQLRPDGRKRRRFRGNLFQASRRGRQQRLGRNGRARLHPTNLVHAFRIGNPGLLDLKERAYPHLSRRRKNARARRAAGRHFQRKTRRFPQTAGRRIARRILLLRADSLSQKLQGRGRWNRRAVRADRLSDFRQR